MTSFRINRTPVVTRYHGATATDSWPSGVGVLELQDGQPVKFHLPWLRKELPQALKTAGEKYNPYIHSTHQVVAVLPSTTRGSR